MLDALRQRRAVEEPVALVVAHPDDETIAGGGSLHLFRRLLLVHVTDGAPRRLPDAARQGFSSPEAYAAARARELDAAIALSGAAPTRLALEIPDQDASGAIPAIADRLRTLFRREKTRTVLTHAYEGGHPDHDATALAVHLAADGRAVFEFPLYHADPGGRLVPGDFLPSAERETTIDLPPHDLARKRAMIACFVTQAAILSQFDGSQEKYRRAPERDWTAPPHPGRLLYEHWGWEMTGADWRRRARAALALEGPCAA